MPYDDPSLSELRGYYKANAHIEGDIRVAVLRARRVGRAFRVKRVGTLGLAVGIGGLGVVPP